MNWFEKYFEDRTIPNQRWVIKSPDGLDHLMDTQLVISLIKRVTKPREAHEIKSNLMLIDRSKADPNIYLETLARAYVLQNWKKKR